MLWIVAYNPHTAAPNLLLTIPLLEKRKNIWEEVCDIHRFGLNSELLISAVFWDLFAPFIMKK